MTCVAYNRYFERITGAVASAREGVMWIVKPKRSTSLHQNAFGKEGITGHAKGLRPCF